MAHKRLVAYLFPSYFLIGAITVIALGWYTSQSVTRFNLDRTSSDLEARARLITHEISGRGPVDSSEIDRLTKEVGKTANMRVTIIDGAGVVLGDSHEDPSLMDNHADRPEIISALAGEVGSSIRFSYTLNQDMMYLAIPMLMQDETNGVIRTSLALTKLDETIAQLRTQIAIVALIILVMTAVVAYFVAKWISRPVLAMKLQAERFAAGDLQGRITIPAIEELGSLARSLNEMASQLDYRIGIITQQRNEQTAILASMIEGVIAVDHNENIIRLNKSAERLFSIEEEQALGHPIQEIVRNPGIQKFVKRTLLEDANMEAELMLDQERKAFFHISGSVIKNDAGVRIGALVVLNDITRLKQLEDMRREFIANVSHELKTPITSIKGFAETLITDKSLNASDTDRFLEIVARQSDRLNSIIDDLLTLSSIEQMESATQLELVKAPLRPIIEAAVQDCSLVIEQRKVRVEIDCPESLTAQANVHLLELAFSNLIGNAARYGAENGSVTITVMAGDIITINVVDDGPGIAAEHLPHLFTRFYRIGRDRSRKAGGTGLGLAIVKHIAIAHKGTVEVSSQPGTGSTFSIQLPG